jgi:outer membrane protein OmpA-like peptidoglycan-associated protein
MKREILAATIALTSALPLAIGQEQKTENRDAPIYRVTVIERTMKAINYAYRSGPTTIDFRGTVLLPKAKGEAIVESKQGRTEIDARFENLATPQGFGLEYMTYVLWAVTPEGRPRNLGEVVANSSDKASLHVTTDLKAFGLLITAEPYSAVRQPSDVVVAENRVREDTIGKIEEINVRYDLMPRGHYTWDMSNQLKAEVANAPKVSMHKYEALLELYQARNALAIAKNAGANNYAPNTFAKAQALLTEAEQLNANKNADSHRVVDSAREASQTAEDARQIAERRMHEEQLAQADAKVSSAEQAKINALAEAERARADADAARSQADAERTARQQAEADAASARDRAAHAEQVARDNAAKTAAATAVVTVRVHDDQAENAKIELRMRLLEQLNGTLASRDTAWGLMVTVPDRIFSGAVLRPITFDHLRRISEIVTAHPGLRVVVEGHSDKGSDALALRRAQAVRDQLIASGLPSSIVEVRPMGDSRPLGSNTTEAGREQNRRVEIVISGDPIGKFPYWDRPYALTTQR